MPYVIDTKHNQEARDLATRKRPFGPGIHPDTAQFIVRVVVVGSSFSDPGTDWCRFDCYDAKGAQLASVHVEGY